jgi:hypothetical protein
MTAETPKPRWKAIWLRSYGSRSHGPLYSSDGLAHKVHQRIKIRDRRGEKLSTVETAKPRRPIISFLWELVMVYAEAVREARRTCGLGRVIEKRFHSGI